VNLRLQNKTDNPSRSYNTGSTPETVPPVFININVNINATINAIINAIINAPARLLLPPFPDVPPRPSFPVHSNDGGLSRL
jgi:hypothetical protein